MRILLDECLPRDLAKLIEGHRCATAKDMGWDGKKNGDLLRLAEKEFDVFLTIDRNLPLQQNISKFEIAVVVLKVRDNRIQSLAPLIPDVLKVLDWARPGEVIRLGA